MSTVELHDSASLALFTSSQRAVLGLLYAHHDQSFYLREIAEVTGLGLGHVQRELNRLASGGILVREERGRHVYFQANRGCPIFDELRAIVRKTMGAVALLKAALLPLRHKIMVAFVFGSLSRGEENAGSDIDLLVIGDATFADMVAATRSAERELRRPINPTIYPPGEFRAKVRAGNHFLNSVLKRDILLVAGDQDELGTLLEKRLGTPARKLRRGNPESPGHRRS